MDIGQNEQTLINQWKLREMFNSGRDLKFAWSRSIYQFMPI